MPLYGEETTKSLSNFPSFARVDHDFIKSIILIKKAAALANHEAEVLSESKLESILTACDTLLSGEHQDQFVTDSLQGGAGTSLNMNVNEVIASLASNNEPIHPLDDVNKSQSTNDVLPTALRVDTLNRFDKLKSSLNALAQVFTQQAQEFKSIKKVGRTHLQDAVTISLSQEWRAYAAFVNRSINRLDQAGQELLITNLGGTAVGTGVGAAPDYTNLVHKHLQQLTQTPFRPSKDLLDATQNLDPLVSSQQTLAVISGGLCKITSDLRLLASGPRAGIGELKLPAVQKGSTIMPGKVNPVVLEYVNQIAFDIAGKTHASHIALISGQLELNVFFPLLAKNLIESSILLNNAVDTLTKYASKIEANLTRCQELLDRSFLSGVDRAAQVGYDQSEREIKTKLHNS